MNLHGRLKKLEGDPPATDPRFCVCLDSTGGCDLYVKKAEDQVLLPGGESKSSIAPIYDPGKAKVCEACAKPTNKPG